MKGWRGAWVSVAVVALCSCSATNPGPVQDEWAKPGSEAFCLTEKGNAGIRYSVQAFYPPEQVKLKIDKIELPTTAKNVRILGVKATQTTGMMLDTGYGWPTDVDPAVNAQFKPETWVDLPNLEIGPKSKGRVQIFVGIERIDPKLPGILPGIEMTYKADNATHTITSVAYVLIDSKHACADQNWKEKITPDKS